MVLDYLVEWDNCVVREERWSSVGTDRPVRLMEAADIERWSRSAVDVEPVVGDSCCCCC